MLVTRLRALLLVGLIVLAPGSRLTGVITDPARPPTSQPNPPDDAPQTVNQQAESHAPPKAPRTDLYGDPLPEGAIARMGTLRFRHPTGVRSICISNDANTLVSSGWDGIRMWDAGTAKQRRHFGDESVRANSISLSPDGKLLASGGL